MAVSVPASASLLNNEVAQEIKNDSIVLENDFVRVIKNATVRSAADAGIFGKRIIVALSKLKYKTGNRIRTINRGDVFVLLPAQSIRIKKGEYFEVAFKKIHPEPKGPEQWLEPQKNTIVYEDDLFRVFEERLAAGDTRALHSHAQRVVVRLNRVQLTDPRINPIGVPGEGIQVPNTVKFAEPMVHVVKNLSTDTPLFNIIIEFKTPVYTNRIK
jgi:hypothetical protein